MADPNTLYPFGPWTPLTSDAEPNTLRPFGAWHEVSAEPLSLTGASVQLESPYTNGDEVATASAVGGSTPYSYSVVSAASDTEVLKVTGTLDPDATGYYVENGTYNDEKAYERADGSYWIWWDGFSWLITIAKGDADDYWAQADGILEGDYDPGGISGYTGTATVAAAAPFAVNSSTGAITVADADALVVGHTWTVVVRATDAASATDDGTWTVELVAGSAATMTRRINQYFTLAGSYGAYQVQI